MENNATEIIIMHNVERVSFVCAMMLIYTLPKELYTVPNHTHSQTHIQTHADAPISKPILLNGTSVMCNYYLRFENWKLNGKSIWQQEMLLLLLLPVSISSDTHFEVIHLKCERQFQFKWRRRFSMRCSLDAHTQMQRK